ncbi:MAG: nuclease [Calditrichaeota bacterium]|nr:MAG: nuclease [Calditrichota bacterium]
MDDQLYTYRAKIVSVYDGDTVHADIDLGLSTWIKAEKLRLARINAPELRGPERDKGLVARDFLRQKILDQQVIVETIKDKKGKFGRYIAEIWLKNEQGEFVNVNDIMVQAGHAVYQEY